MIQIPMTILLSLVVFIIIGGVLLLVFGSPDCDRLANTTAFYLKTSIDEVSDPNFPTWDDSSNPPADEDLSYYRTAPIRLCQDKGISWWDNIVGTTMVPQYQIYYERFPEGGGGIWSEAYPWSGGAASSLKMWAFMRVGTGAFKLASKYLTNGAIYGKFLDYAGGKAMKFFKTFGETKFDDVIKTVGRTELADQIGDAATKSSTYYFKAIKTGEALGNIEEAVRNGDIVSQLTDDTFVISHAKRTVYTKVNYINELGKEDVFFAETYVKRQGGEIVGMTTKDMSRETGWELLQASPDEMYKQWLEEVPESTRNAYKGVYVAQSDLAAGTITKAVGGSIRNSKYYKAFYQPIEDNLMKIVKGFETVGYRIKLTTLTTNDLAAIKLAISTALYDNNMGDDVAEMLIKQQGVRETIAKLLGKSPDEIQKIHIQEFLNKIDLNGIAFLPKGSDMEVIVSAAQVVSEAGPKVYSSSDELLTDIMYYNPTLAEDMAKTLGISVPEANDRVSRILSEQVFRHYTAGIDSTELMSKSITSNLLDLSQIYKGGDEKSAAQLANFMGFIEQNKRTLPANVRTYGGTTSDYFKAQAKKMIYLDGPQNLLNPTSFYSKGIMADMQTETCEGNSICLYSHAAMQEHPFYLDESAMTFSENIRSWRQVHPLLNWAGWQAALMHVPEHPRFYVVGPCLANAKVWKIIYNNVPTIFVYPQKAELGDVASNYCYADNNLVNQYTEIWATSDALTVVTTIASFGAAKGAMELTKQILNAVDIVDPVTLGQGIVEGAISWPSWPFKELTSNVIATNAGKIGIKELETGSTKK